MMSTNDIAVMPMDTSAVGEQATAPSSAGTYYAEADASAGRSIIRTGDLSIEVDDPAAAAGEVAGVAEDLGGRIESESIDRSGNTTSAYLLVRVPSEKLDEAFEKMGEIGEVRSQSRGSSDVTTVHVDLQARVGALESSVARLTALMNDAATTSELIEAESALAQRQQELDGLKAQLASLEGQVDEATISVALYTPSALPGGGPNGFWEGLVAGFNSIIAAGAGALVIAGILLPWLVFLGVIAALTVWVVRVRRRRRS